VGYKRGIISVSRSGCHASRMPRARVTAFEYNCQRDEGNGAKKSFTFCPNLLHFNDAVLDRDEPKTEVY